MSVGQQLFSTPGTYLWTCPADVTSVSVVCVGGGGSGSLGNTGKSIAGGGGGALAYVNNISVTPGQKYRVVVGKGAFATRITGGSALASNGGDSLFIDTSVVFAGGGKGGGLVSLDIGGLGGTYTATTAYGTNGGGNGGKGGNAGAVSATSKQAAGGGGAGGYYSSGGEGGYGFSASGAVENYQMYGQPSSSGGGGGAGAAWNGIIDATIAPGGGGGGTSVYGYVRSTWGGVDIYGGGLPGSTSVPNSTYDATRGVPAGGSQFGGDGGYPGGGGGGSSNDGAASGLCYAGSGANGAVRIIWPGDQREFPFTHTEDLTEIPNSVEGAASFIVPGTYSWKCPSNVTSVSAVCIGGGAGGGTYGDGFGGGGGGLAWKNNITVVPGQSYTVVVGTYGLGAVYNGRVSTAGGDSYFINATTVKGGGGNLPAGVTTGALGGTYIGDGGGNGGKGGMRNSVWMGGGGGGAGGYAGDGGQGGTDGGNGFDGKGGAGGGGGSSVYQSNGTPVSEGLAAGGGGTGIFGQGQNGQGGLGGGNEIVVGIAEGGGGGSDGMKGLSPLYNANVNACGRGGNFGGGGGAVGNGAFGATGGEGGGGAVRLVWPGDTRQFPFIDVGNPGASIIFTTDLNISSGGSATFSIKNIPNNIDIYWVNVGNLNSTDFTDGLNNGKLNVVDGTSTLVRETVSGIILSNRTIIIQLRYYSVTGPIIMTSNQVIMNKSGQAEFTTPGTYTWIAPERVTTVSVVAVGGGGGSATLGTGSGNGGDSYFISGSTVKGGGGAQAGYTTTVPGLGGTYVGDGGGNGGRPDPTQSYSVGGGGAGGYSGTGGTGMNYNGTGGTAGSGGGGGGGGRRIVHTTGNGGGGGGVGIYGQGADGALGNGNSSSTSGGDGGSLGAKGGPASSAVGGSGGLFGGGGGGGNTTNAYTGACGGGLGYKNNITVVPGQSYTVVVGAGGGGDANNGAGGGGAVRIIWPGNQRAFPSTSTADE